MVYRRTEAEKACTQEELDLARLDGCNIVWLAAPKELIGDNGKLTALVCDVMQLGAPDHSGKPAPIPTGETITIETDMVIKATGQKPFEDIVNYYGIENRRGKITPDEKHATNILKIFAGGDCVNGGKEVVDAVQAGKEAAAAIINYIT
jgi:glutamate synthase (NADPH/NADH) small chain